MVYRDLLCRYVYTAAPTNDKVTSQQHCCSSPSDLDSCRPTGFHVCQCQCSLPLHFQLCICPPPAWLPSPASMAVCTSRGRALQHQGPSAVHESRSSSSICAPVCFQPNPHHLPPQHCSHPGTDNVAKVSTLRNRDPTTACGTRSGSAFYHWLAPTGKTYI